MYKLRLLERLAKLEDLKENQDKIITEEDELNSIFSYLKKILSTKEGSTLIAYDFGIPDITNFHNQDFGEYIRTLESRLKDTIEKYEPRLTDLNVKYEDKYKDKSILNFKINAKLSHNINNPVEFVTQLKPNVEIKIDEKY